VLLELYPECCWSFTRCVVGALTGVLLQLYPEQTLPSDRSSQLRRKCLEEAETMVAAKNVGDDDVTIGSKRAVRDDGLTDLITQLTSLMLQVKVSSWTKYCKTLLISVQSGSVLKF